MLYPQFQEITLDLKLRNIAAEHATKRTKEIIRQFVPRNAPLSAVESNYVGAIGELMVRQYLGLTTLLEDNYIMHQIDDGDIEWGGLIYDVKTDAVVSSSYKKIYSGVIKNYEPYACRVYTAKHLHHLPKYTGGLIFCVFEIPNNSRETKIENEIRSEIFNNDKGLIIGYVTQKDVTKNPPTQFTPKNPFTGSQMKYNSLNYIFHHTELQAISTII